jgi:hypothetical protein
MPRHLNQYNFILAPLCMRLTPAMARLLEEFVTGGGTLLGDALCATIGEGDLAYPVAPGAGLDRVFSARFLEFTASESTVSLRKKGISPYPVSLEGLYYRQAMETLGTGKPLYQFNNGETAATVNRFGLGKAFLFGTSLFAFCYHDPRSPSGAFLHQSALESGVRPAMVSSDPLPGSLALRASLSGRKAVLFCENAGQNPVSVRISLRSDIRTGSARIIHGEKDVSAILKPGNGLKITAGKRSAGVIAFDRC